MKKSAEKKNTFDTAIKTINISFLLHVRHIKAFSSVVFQV